MARPFIDNPGPKGYGDEATSQDPRIHISQRAESAAPVVAHRPRGGIVQTVFELTPTLLLNNPLLNPDHTHYSTYLPPAPMVGGGSSSIRNGHTGYGAPSHHRESRDTSYSFTTPPAPHTGQVQPPYGYGFPTPNPRPSSISTSTSDYYYASQNISAHNGSGNGNGGGNGYGGMQTSTSGVVPMSTNASMINAWQAQQQPFAHAHAQHVQQQYAPQQQAPQQQYRQRESYDSVHSGQRPPVYPSQQYIQQPQYQHQPPPQQQGGYGQQQYGQSGWTPGSSRSGERSWHGH